MLIFDGRGAERLADRDWELTAGEKACGFARERGQVWLGKDAHQTIVGGNVECSGDVETKKFCRGAESRAAGYRAEDSERRAAGAGSCAGALANAELESAGGIRREQVDAHRFQDCAVDLGDADLERHLKRSRHLQTVDDADFAFGPALGHVDARVEFRRRQLGRERGVFR